MTMRPALLTLLTPVLTLSSCAPAPARPAPPAPIKTTPPAPAVPALPVPTSPVEAHGVVVDASGHGVADATVVVFAGAAMDPRPLVRTGPDGSFALPFPAEASAIAVTGAAGYAWMPDQKALPDRIVLSETCDAVTGEVAGADAHAVTGSILRFLLLDEQMAAFTAVPAPDGSFDVCLPRGRYAVVTEGAVVAFPAELDTKGSRTLGIQGLARAVVETPVGSSPSAWSLADFVRAIPPGVRVIGVGEANHGTAEFLSVRADLALALAAAGRVDVIMLEAGVGEVFALDDYVHGAPVDVRKAIATLGYWMWNTHEFEAFLARVRDYNVSAPANRRVHLVGCDVQDTAAAIDTLLTDPSMSKDVRDLLELLKADRGAAWKSVSAGDRRVVDAFLGRRRSGRGLDSADVRHALAAQGVALRLASLADTVFGGFLVRDSGMEQMVTLTLKLSPASRVIAFGHNGHVAREPTMTITTMGQHLGRRLGKGYFAVGLFSFSGEAWAWNPAGTAREANKLAPAPAYSLEDVVLDQDRDAAAFVSLASAPPALATWLKTPRFVREFGAQSSGGDKDLLLRSIPQAFDGVIVVKTGTATTPLPALAPPPAAN